MDKKTIFLELPAEMIDQIDRNNEMGDRSTFISDLLNKQLQTNITTMNFTPEIQTSMQSPNNVFNKPGEIKVVDSKGIPLGNFDIDTVEGFENLGKKISEISNDPIVRMKARKWI